MPAPAPYGRIRHVVHISTHRLTACELCREPIGGDQFAASVNHYLTAHGYKLLHVGAETTQDHQGQPWHTTVAVLGI